MIERSIKKSQLKNLKFEDGNLGIGRHEWIKNLFIKRNFFKRDMVDFILSINFIQIDIKISMTIKHLYNNIFIKIDLRILSEINELTRKLISSVNIYFRLIKF